MFDHFEDRMCDSCDIDYCQVCYQYLSEGQNGLCRTCLAKAAEEYIRNNTLNWYNEICRETLTLFYIILVTLDRIFYIMEDGGYFELQPYKKNVSFKYEKLDLTNQNDNKDDDSDDIIFNL